MNTKSVLLLALLVTEVSLVAVPTGGSSIRSGALVTDADPIEVAFAQLQSQATPDGITPDFWRDMVVEQLLDNDGELLQLNVSNLTTAQVENILRAIPLFIRSLIGALDISENQLTTLPPSLHTLVNLEQLIVHTNRLANLTGIEQLNQLRLLNAQGNLIQSFPEQLDNLYNLSAIFIDHNRLQRMPAAISQLPLTLLAVDRTVALPPLTAETQIIRR